MDAIDAAAIELLQADGRISYSDMAKRLGVARASVSERVSELVSEGRIRVVAAIHPLVLGLKSIAHVSLQVSGETSSVVERIAKLDSVVFLSESVGRFQLFLELRTAEISDIARELENIRAIPGVQTAEVLIYEEIVQSLFHEEGEISESFHLDAFDLAIMSELQKDGRMNFAVLGERVGLSTSASRKRVLRLLEHNIMRIGAIQRRIAGSDQAALFGLGLSLDRRGDEVLRLLGEHAGVEFLARTIGRFSIVATIACTQAERIALIRSLRELPGVLAAESWLHAEVVIERYDRRMVLP